MPYITSEDRRFLDEFTTLFLKRAPYIKNAGMLNYLITKLVDAFLTEKGLRYANVNEVIGAMECAKLELYRRLAAPYEDMKIEQNGDVYDARPE